MKKLLFFVGFGYLMLFYGCKKPNSDNPLDSDLEFHFQLLDRNRQVARTFKQGDNFRFSFVIINKTKKGWGLKQESFDENDDFFRVYKTFDDKKTAGRPLLNPVTTFKIPFIPVLDTLRLEMDWMPSKGSYYGTLDNYHFENKPLPIGTYKTGFTNVFEFYSEGVGSTTFKTNPLTFNVDFDVK